MKERKRRNRRRKQEQEKWEGEEKKQESNHLCLVVLFSTTVIAQEKMIHSQKPITRCWFWMQHVDGPFPRIGNPLEWTIHGWIAWNQRKSLQVTAYSRMRWFVEKHNLYIHCIYLDHLYTNFKEMGRWNWFGSRSLSSRLSSCFFVVMVSFQGCWSLVSIYQSSILYLDSFRDSELFHSHVLLCYGFEHVQNI